MEYWITPRGRVIKVDDNKNHVYVVTKHCLNKVCGKLQKIRGKYQEFAQAFIQIVQDCTDYRFFDTIQMRSYICDSLDRWVEDGIITEDDARDVSDLITKLTGCDPDTLSVIFGSYHDPREYGIKKLGWTRISYNRVVVPKLTQQVCDNILKVYDTITNGRISIEVGFGGRYFSDVPKSALLDYRLIGQ